MERLRKNAAYLELIRVLLGKAASIDIRATSRSPRGLVEARLKQRSVWARASTLDVLDAVHGRWLVAQPAKEAYGESS